MSVASVEEILRNVLTRIHYVPIELNQLSSLPLGFQRTMDVYNAANYASIQAAIDDCGENGGGVVDVPAGTYNFDSSSLSVCNNLTLIGAGSSTIFTTLGTSSYWTGALHGIIEIPNKNNITIQGIKFDTNGSARWLWSKGHNNLKVINCEFTSDATVLGQFLLWGYNDYGLANMTNTKILDCWFHDMPSVYPIRLYPRDYTIEHTEIAGCVFEDCYAPAILIDSYGNIKDTNIHHNQFIDLIQTGGIPNDYAWAVHSGLMNPYYVYDTKIHHNWYHNSRTGQYAGFVADYSSYNSQIHNNTATLTTAASELAICFALGRTTSPAYHMKIKDNYIENFQDWIDLDAVSNFECSGNIIKNCGTSLLTGYGVQEYLDVHNNKFINCLNSVFTGMMVLGNSNPLKSKIQDNDFIDTRSSPSTTHPIFLTGGYDFSDVTIRGNKFYMPNKAFTAMIGSEGGYSPTSPRVIIDNEVHDSAGIKLKSKNSGTSTGTGAQQTIAHGLWTTPTNVSLSMRGVGTAYESAATDTTNIYVTATNTINYRWKAEV